MSDLQKIALYDPDTDKNMGVNSSEEGLVNARISNSSGTVINPATEESLSQLAMAIVNAIDQTAYNLNSAAFSALTSITSDYIFDSVELNFSTTQAKTITITSGDGTILWGGSVDTSADNLGYNTTAQHFNLIFDQAFNANDNITVAVTQTAGACSLDVILKIKQGTNTLVGNPVLGSGTDTIGYVRLKYYDVETLTFEDLKGHEGGINIISYTDAIGQDKITGHSSFQAFGDRSSLSTVSTGDDVWTGISATCPIPDQTVGEQLTLVSTSTSDTSAGVGVRQVDVHGIDITGAEVSEIVTLLGTTPVNTVRTNWRFVQNIHTETVGTTGSAVGTISVYRLGDAARVYNRIDIGGNFSLNSARMVPAGKILFIKDLSFCAASSKAIVARLRATSTPDGAVTSGYFFLFKNSCTLQDSTCIKEFSVPLKFPALSIVKVTAWSTQAGGSISAGYNGWLES